MNPFSPDTRRLPADQQPTDDGSKPIDLAEYTKYLGEVMNQPAWRARADREMDYVDGNQLNAAVLQRQRELGMPPAIEPLIGPAIEAVTGLEAKTRTDWKVSANTDGADDIADALNFKLNQAERHSGADRACTDAFRPQLCVGIGWVEVARERDPFKYKYRCTAVHRNEIWWDMLSKEPNYSDARYLVRRRWTDSAQALLKFPAKADLIRAVTGRWGDQFLSYDGGASTDLAMAWADERGWSIEEQEWRDSTNGRVCLFEVWYRRWVSTIVLKLPDDRVVEYDPDNEMHNVAIASGVIMPVSAVISKVRVSFWLGPHLLADGPSPYTHNHFPYVPFWGQREDRTGVPYGRVRGMVYLQDNVNASISKIRWGLSATRTIRTKGAVAYPDEVFRTQIGRVDADIVLNADEMARPGAMFKVERDFQLNEQQYKMLQDSRVGIERASGISSAFQGRQGTATSGVQESTQVEQATQSLATLMDNFKFGRAMVGELLLSMIVEDIGTTRTEILVKGNVVTPDRTIVLNDPCCDEESGEQYLTNDLQRTMLRVSMSEVPTTQSFRTQQLSSMSEAFKSMPQQYQVVALPYLLQLMDIPDKDEIIKAIKDAQQNQTPEQIQEQINKAVDDALAKAQYDLKSRELDLKYDPSRLAAELDKIVSETVKNGVQSAFAAMQAGQTIAQMPQIAPIADVVMQSAGYRKPSPAGQDPNFPQPVGVPVPPTDVQQNTSPQLPPVPQQAGSAVDGADAGIETARTNDNFQPTTEGA